MIWDDLCGAETKMVGGDQNRKWVKPRTDCVHCELQRCCGKTPTAELVVGGTRIRRLFSQWGSGLELEKRLARTRTKSLSSGNKADESMVPRQVQTYETTSPAPSLLRSIYWMIPVRPEVGSFGYIPSDDAPGTVG